MIFAARQEIKTKLLNSDMKGLMGLPVIHGLFCSAGRNTDFAFDHF